MLCQIVVGPQFQNFMSLCSQFTCRRALENVDCYPKISTHKKNFTFLKVAPETTKATKYKTIFLCKDQKQFCLFLENSIVCDCSLMYKEGF